MQPKKTEQEVIILGVGLAILVGLLVMRGCRPAVKPSVGEIGGLPMSEEEVYAVMSRRPVTSVKKGVKPARDIETTVATVPVSAIAAKEIGYTGRQNKDPLDNSYLIPKEPPKPAAPAVTEEPVKPEVVVEFPTGNFRVTAVLWGSKRPQAIINDNVMGIGEKLDGGKITGIDKDGIHVSYEGKEVLLQIK